jgi:hypothetical protein
VIGRLIVDDQVLEKAISAQSQYSGGEPDVG